MDRDLGAGGPCLWWSLTPVRPQLERIPVEILVALDLVDLHDLERLHRQVLPLSSEEGRVPGRPSVATHRRQRLASGVHWGTRTAAGQLDEVVPAACRRTDLLPSSFHPSQVDHWQKIARIEQTVCGPMP